MKNITIKILLVLMILLSLFSGISINGNWGFVYQYEFIDFLELHEIAFRDYLLWGVVILSHIGIVLLPFLTGKRYFKKILLYFPLAYLLSYLLLRAEFFILLIPFMILWIVVMAQAKKAVT